MMRDYKLGWNMICKLCILSIATIAIYSSDINWYDSKSLKAQETPTRNLLPAASRHTKIYHLCQAATVRVIKADSAGSGVIINREGNIYSVLTNWHVVDSSKPMILTMDDQQHRLVQSPKQLGDVDLAVVQFYSESEYPIAEIETEMPHVGETVYAAGFPLAIDDLENSLKLGNKAFRLTQGEVSIIPIKSLPQGYQLGYTNDTEIGMSGSPIFNSRGLLVGIHGRGKYRDPSFGVYVFDDGSEPSPQELEQMIKSSWGIPISIYSELSK